MSKFVLLVCGGRDYVDRADAFSALDRVNAKHRVQMVVQGGADGADALAAEWARERGIHCAEVPAMWKVHKNAAGPKRNRAMLLLSPDAVVAFPGGVGTADMVRAARDAGIPVWEPMA